MTERQTETQTERQTERQIKIQKDRDNRRQKEGDTKKRQSHQVLEQDITSFDRAEKNERYVLA